MAAVKHINICLVFFDIRRQPVSECAEYAHLLSLAVDQHLDVFAFDAKRTHGVVIKSPRVFVSKISFGQAFVVLYADDDGYCVTGWRELECFGLKGGGQPGGQHRLAPQGDGLAAGVAIGVYRGDGVGGISAHSGQAFDLVVTLLIGTLLVAVNFQGTGVATGLHSDDHQPAWVWR